MARRRASLPWNRVRSLRPVVTSVAVERGDSRPHQFAISGPQASLRRLFITCKHVAMGQHRGRFALHDFEVTAREPRAFFRRGQAAPAPARSGAPRPLRSAGGVFCASASSIITMKAESSRSHWNAGSSKTRLRYCPVVVMGATSRS